MAQQVIKVCPVDGVEFMPKRSTRVYCKPRCRKIAFTNQQKTDEDTGRVAVQPNGMTSKICKKCGSPMLGDRCLQKSCA